MLPLLVSAQTFSDGWQEGYKKGYCDNDIGCIEPIPPISPVMPINSSGLTDYQFGYNEGFKAGMGSKSNGVNVLNYDLGKDFFNRYSEALKHHELDFSDFSELSNTISNSITPEMYANAARLKAEGEGINYLGDGIFTLQKTGANDMVGYKKVNKQALELVEDFTFENDFEYEIISTEKQKVKVGGPSWGVNRCLVKFSVQNDDGSEYIGRSDVEKIYSDISNFQKLYTENIISDKEYTNEIKERASRLYKYFKQCVYDLESTEDASQLMDEITILKNINFFTEEVYNELIIKYKQYIFNN
tara:strand:+ start:114 stop:1016 length:903 start_codon:yes stop_codon:yes gene_type:complete